MPLQAQQIVSLALQIAKAPGFTSQAGQLLNTILQGLCQDYDFDLCRGTFNFNFVVDNGSGNGAGPYTLPADYLRADPNEVFWTLLGQPYSLIPIDLSEFDRLAITPGFADFPSLYCTDMSQSPPVMFVYPPASGAYPVTVRYRRQMPDITAPETSTTVPWFPNQTYLIRRLAGEIMALTDDQRAEEFLTDQEGTMGAGAILRSYLKLKDDQSTRSKKVELDRRRFGRGSFGNLANTKRTGWTLLLAAAMIPLLMHMMMGGGIA